MLAPEAPPGSRFIYANRSYIVAASVLEAAAGEPWEALMQRYIFAPLKMEGAGFGAPGTAGRLDEPVGHASWLTASVTPHPPGSRITDNPAVMGPAGRVHARLTDVLKFLGVHRDRAPLLLRSSWDRLHTPPFGGDYALGWYVRPEGLWHSGTNTLWNAEVLIHRQQNLAAAICCNDGDYGKVSPGLHQALMGSAERCDS
jgi:CubicO group peptidase (beta-lactamase class C family)